MKKTKKLISIVLTFMIVLTMIQGASITAFATEMESFDEEVSYYSMYDLNLDGKVSSLDLACAMLYVELLRDNMTSRVVDNYGMAIYPYMCEFNGDGIINTLDLIDLMLHYNVFDSYSLRLFDGYEATSTDTFITSDAELITIRCEHDYGGKITWNTITKKLDIAQGLTSVLTH